MKYQKGKIAIVSMLAMAGLLFGCKQGEKIETIGNFSVTTQDYEDYYSTYLEKAARFANAEKTTLYKLMCNPDQAPPNPVIQDMLEKLKPENNYEEYRQMRIIEQVAKNEGFTDRPVVKRIIDQVVLETLVRLYLQEKMDERIKISLEDKQNKCEELRKEFPRRIGPLPLDSCLYIAEGFIKQNIMAREEPKLREEIKESVSVKKNPEFNRETYLKENLDLYKAIQKEGGCNISAEAGSSSTPSKP